MPVLCQFLALLLNTALLGISHIVSRSSTAFASLSWFHLLLRYKRVYMSLLWNASFLVAPYVYIIWVYILMKIPWYQTVAIIPRDSFQKTRLSTLYRKMFFLVYSSLIPQAFQEKGLVEHSLYYIAFPKLRLSQISMMLFTSSSLVARVLGHPHNLSYISASASEWIHFYPCAS